MSVESPGELARRLRIVGTVGFAAASLLAGGDALVGTAGLPPFAVAVLLAGLVGVVATLGLWLVGVEWFPSRAEPPFAVVLLFGLPSLQFEAAGGYDRLTAAIVVAELTMAVGVILAEWWTGSAGK